MSVLGIIKKSTSSSAGDKLILGSSGLTYVFNENENAFASFYDVCCNKDADWCACLDDAGLSVLGFHAKVLALLNSIGTQANVTGLKSRGYVSESVVRKIILAESDSGRWAEALAVMSVKELVEISVDEGEYLLSVDEGVLVEELSYLCFQRKDWGLFVSCFTCLWHDVIKSLGRKALAINFARAKGIVASDGFAQFIKERNRHTGSTSVPFNLVTAYCKSEAAATAVARVGAKRKR